MRFQTRIAREVRHRQQMEALGYRWRQCRCCSGSRHVLGQRRKCAVCRGAGGKFVEPQN